MCNILENILDVDIKLYPYVAATCFSAFSKI